MAAERRVPAGGEEGVRRVMVALGLYYLFCTVLGNCFPLLVNFLNVCFFLLLLTAVMMTFNVEGPAWVV